MNSERMLFDMYAVLQDVERCSAVMKKGNALRKNLKIDTIYDTIV